MGVAGWPGVALAGTAFAATMIGTTMPTPLYSLYADEFGFGELMITVVFAAYAIGVIAGLLLFGHWSDQLGRRRMLAAGLVLSGLSAAAFLIPGALAWLFVGRVLSGLSAGVVTGTGTAALVDLAPPGGRARASFVAAAVNMAGLGLGPVVAGLLSQYAPLPTKLCFLADLALVFGGLACVAVLREPVEVAANPQLAPRRLHVPEQARAAFTRAAIAGFAGFAVLGLFTAVSPAFLSTVLGNTNRAVEGAVVFAVFAASVAGQGISMRLSNGQALRGGCALLIVGMAFVASSLGAKSLALLVIGAVVTGIGQGMSFRAGLASVAGAAPDEQRGEVTSTFFVTLYVGISIPVIGEGALASGVGLVPAGLIFTGIVALLAAIALVLLVRERSAEPVG